MRVSHSARKSKGRAGIASWFDSVSELTPVGPRGRARLEYPHVVGKCAKEPVRGPGVAPRAGRGAPRGALRDRCRARSWTEPRKTGRPERGGHARPAAAQRPASAPLTTREASPHGNRRGHRDRSVNGVEWRRTAGGGSPAVRPAPRLPVRPGDRTGQRRQLCMRFLWFGYVPLLWYVPSILCLRARFSASTVASRFCASKTRAFRASRSSMSLPR